MYVCVKYLETRLAKHRHVNSLVSKKNLTLLILSYTWKYHGKTISECNTYA